MKKKITKTSWTLLSLAIIVLINLYIPVYLTPIEEEICVDMSTFAIFMAIVPTTIPLLTSLVLTETVIFVEFSKLINKIQSR